MLQTPGFNGLVIIFTKKTLQKTAFKKFEGGPFLNTLSQMSLVKLKNDVSIQIGDLNIINKKYEKFSSVQFDYKLSFGNHILEVCKNTCREIPVKILSSRMDMGAL